MRPTPTMCIISVSILHDILHDTTSPELHLLLIVLYSVKQMWNILQKYAVGIFLIKQAVSLCRVVSHNTEQALLIFNSPNYVKLYLC